MGFYVGWLSISISFRSLNIVGSIGVFSIMYDR